MAPKRGIVTDARVEKRQHLRSAREIASPVKSDKVRKSCLSPASASILCSTGGAAAARRPFTHRFNLQAESPGDADKWAICDSERTPLTHFCNYLSGFLRNCSSRNLFRLSRYRCCAARSGALDEVAATAASGVAYFFHGPNGTWAASTKRQCTLSPDFTPR